MPVTFAVNSVLDRTAACVLSALAAQGEPPQSLPRATTAEQAAFLAQDLPATILEAGRCAVSEENCNTGAIRLCQTALIHHVRSLSPGASAVETATARIAAVAVALYRDFTLASVSQPGDQAVEMVRIVEVVGGTENAVQQILDAADENDSLQCVSLKLEIDWVEDDVALV